MANKKDTFKRMNLYIDEDLEKAISKRAKADYLKPTTWIIQFLKKNLLEPVNE